ncbi:hypothetical protein D3C80_2046890 [compost metagenome]
MLFQLLNLPADRTLGQVQAPGGLGEAAAVGHLDERLQGLERGRAKKFIHAL